MNELNFLTKATAVLQLVGLEDVSFTAREFSLPAINLPASKQTTPYVDITYRGDKPEFDSLTFTYIVNSDLTNWLSLYLTIVGLGYPNSLYDRCNLDIKNETTAYIHIYSANNSTILLTIQFHDVILTNLGELSFGSDDDNASIVTSTLTLDYSRYEVVGGYLYDKYIKHKKSTGENIGHVDNC